VAEAIRAAQSDKKFGLRNMKSLRKTILIAAAHFPAILGARLAAQQPPPLPAETAPQQGPQTPQKAEGQARIPVIVNLVVVPVIVKDGAGRIVPDLRKDEFRIFEDKAEQRISYFSAEAFPISMVVLIDNDLKSRDAKQVADSLRAIVAGLSASDEVQVCRFDQFFHAGKDFISDQDKLLVELKRTHLDDSPSVAPPGAAINNGPSINGHSATSDAPNITGAMINIKGQSTKALDDAVYAAAQLLRDRGRDRRKMILLISDGINGKKSNVNDYSTVRNELLRSNIAVYGVGVGSAVFDRRFERLAKYAHDTGGDVYYGMKSRAMEELYSRVTEEARNQYTLAYAPSGSDRGTDYHEIEVRVKREGLTILAREGYFSGGVPR